MDVLSIRTERKQRDGLTWRVGTAAEAQGQLVYLDYINSISINTGLLHSATYVLYPIVQYTTFEREFAWALGSSEPRFQSSWPAF